MPRYSIRGDVLPARAVLAQRFPQTFFRKGSPTKKPLKTGIRNDVLAAVKDIPRMVLILAINDYCSGPKYASAMIPGAVRVDLDGNPAGVVSERDHAYHRAREERRQEGSRAAQHRLRRTPVEVEARP